LALVNLAVEARAFEEVFMSAAFDDTAFVEEQDQVGAAHGAEAVGNDECGSSDH
jgi:hypothetical protein